MTVSYYDENSFPEKTVIEIVDDDTFSIASEGDCCLNFASHKRPGGGYKSVQDLKMIIKTQEEDLFRRSNLPEIMDTPEIRKHYPLMGVTGLYCEATVSKDKLLNPIEPFNVGIVTVPAVVNPQIEDLELVENKARLIFDIAAEHGHKTLILGAWGCGIFNNDPYGIANLFLTLSKEYKFDKIIFAVPGKESVNHKVFQDAVES